MRKTFFEDRSKRLYFIKGRQLISITESSNTVLFLYLESQWEIIKKEYEELNKDSSGNIPVVLQFDFKTYQTLTSATTKDMIMRIGFDLTKVIVVVIEKTVMKAITDLENKEKKAAKIQEASEMINIKKASELANRTPGTVRTWLKKGYNIKYEKTKKGYLINKQSLVNHLNTVKH